MLNSLCYFSDFLVILSTQAHGLQSTLGSKVPCWDLINKDHQFFFFFFLSFSPMGGKGHEPRFLISYSFHCLVLFPKRFKVSMLPVPLLVFVMPLGAYHTQLSEVCFSYLWSYVFVSFCCSFFSPY